MRVRINLVRLVGNSLALSMAYSIWGWKGCLFTLGLILGSK